MEKPRELVRSERARIDLLEIWAYLCEHASEETADAQLRRIEVACERLSNIPFLGRSRSEIKTNLRSLAVEPYVVFYRVTEATIEIVRVVHGRRDFRRIFKGDQSG